MKIKTLQLWALACLGLGACGADTPQPTAAETAEYDPDPDERMATLINLNGHLCAKVVFVGPEVGTGERQVNCNEYRDPKKSGSKTNLVVYMVDLSSGEVRQVGPRR